jgi:hypothetical protein
MGGTLAPRERGFYDDCEEVKFERRNHPAQVGAFCDLRAHEA